MPHITLSIYLSLLGHTFTITDPAKRRTSQHTRPIVLKFYALLIECNVVQEHPPPTRHLLIEEFQPDLSTVKVYDPLLGQHIVPLRDLLHLSVTGIIFKRSSQKQLVCPKLLQSFTALALPKHIPAHRSPFSIISLFDGSGSFTDVIAKALEAWPHAILAAENDAGTRAVVSKVKGWPIDGTLWTLDKNGAQTFYAQDVWSLINNHCLLLRQFLSLLPEDSVMFLAAGSPCPDLTIIGRGQGLLGLGDRSVLIHCFWAVIYYLSFTSFWKRLVILIENAGSMKDHMKLYIYTNSLVFPLHAVTISTALNGVQSPERGTSSPPLTQRSFPQPPLHPLTMAGPLLLGPLLNNLSPYPHGYDRATLPFVAPLYRLLLHTTQSTLFTTFPTSALSNSS